MEQEDNSKKMIIIITSLLTFLLILLLPIKNNTIKIVMYLVCYIIIGLEIIIKSIKNILKGNIIEENFLMSIATIGAILIGEYKEAIIVMLFYQIGEFLQDYATDKSKKRIKDLMDIRPDYANVLENKNWIKKKPEEVYVGDIILVKPGEKIPLDGTITNGSSLIDTKALTGESIPKSVTIGDKVFNGCINNISPLEIEVSCNYEKSTVSKILALIETADNQKAKGEKFITKFAKIYTPTVIIAATLLAIIPSLITKTFNTSWLYRALSFLVASCPCALVISIPLSFFAGIGLSAKEGILIKGSNYLENLSKVKQIAFDKTGTLTEGKFQVQKVESISLDKEKLLELVAYAEYHSIHPIAISIKEYYGKEIKERGTNNTEELPGLGIKTTIKGKTLLVGNDLLMKKNNISYKKCNEVGTILYIAIDNTYEGYIVISDKIKNNVKESIKTLKDKYKIKTTMLTGDKKELAKHVKEELGIDTYMAELLPIDKVEKIKELKKKDGLIAFVGDGINDAPVLAISDIGISMGGLGSDAAIEASDIVIMKDDISKLITSIQISNLTLKIVKENIIFSILIKIIILILSALGITSMWLAVFADVGVSILAIINSLRLLKIRLDEKNEST